MTTTQTYTFDWEDNYSHGDTVKLARLQVDDFNCVVKVVWDTDHDFQDGRDHFSSKWEEGAIKYPEARYNNRVHTYFIPDYTIREQLRDYKNNLGWSVQDARRDVVRIIKEDTNIVADPSNAGVFAYGVTASLYFKGIELSESSLWGCEIAGCDEAYLDEVANEVIYEALERAHENLSALRETEVEA
jgi:hypothetical protein